MNPWRVRWLKYANVILDALRYLPASSNTHFTVAAEWIHQLNSRDISAYTAFLFSRLIIHQDRQVFMELVQSFVLKLCVVCMEHVFYFRQSYLIFVCRCLILSCQWSVNKNRKTEIHMREYILLNYNNYKKCHWYIFFLLNNQSNTCPTFFGFILL